MEESQPEADRPLDEAEAPKVKFNEFGEIENTTKTQKANWLAASRGFFRRLIPNPINKHVNPKPAPKDISSLKEPIVE